MKNTLQNYAWGSNTAIAKLMARPFPTEQPEAELWLGAHPKAPSKVWVDQRWEPLDVWIEKKPETVLGAVVRTRFDDRLPYLFKILAAEQPLSIQAHPSIAQARLGFANENQLNIPMDAARRNYKDPHHKPECICAITPFWALCGFRQEDDILSILEVLWPIHRRDELAILRNAGVKSFFNHLMDMENSPRVELVAHIAQAAASSRDQTIPEQWMVRLQSKYPGDVGVLAPGLLNLIQLQPGEAIALASGQLHAHLEGLGIELMANSDNVIRGGLTPKHIDVPELMKVLDFNPRCPEILVAQDSIQGEKIYPSVVEEFRLSVITSHRGQVYDVNERSAMPEILLCIRGEATISRSNEEKVALTQGQSVFVPAMVDRYTIDGEAVIYKAAVNM